MNLRNLTAAVLALGLAACSQHFSAVSITAICAPPAPTVSDTSYSCIYPASCDAVLVGNPKLDATTARLDFRLPLEFGNQLVDNSNNDAGRINTNDATIQSLEITYAGATAVAPWTVPVSIAVPTSGTTSAAVPLISVQSFATIAPPSPASTAQLIVNVRGHGVFSSQDTFTTAWFQVPVEVCSGCLANQGGCPAGSVAVFCPSAAPGQASVGQTASGACIALTAP